MLDETDLIRAKAHFERTIKALDRYDGCWSDRDTNNSVDWNTAMPTAARNYCRAMIVFNEVALNVTPKEAKNIGLQSLSALNERMCTFEVLMTEKATRLGMGWRLNVIHEVYADLQDAYLEIKKMHSPEKYRKVTLG